MIEAYANGTPVLASRLGAMQEWWNMAAQECSSKPAMRTIWFVTSRC